MLSNKWTFSLTSLVLMLSLVLIAPSAMAQFAINLSIGADEDVSYADGNQVIYGDTLLQTDGSGYHQDHVCAGDQQR